MLKLHRALAISRTDAPAIRAHSCLGSARVYHWFDGKNHAGPQLHACTFLAEVKHVWFLMQRTANAVPGIFSHRGIAMFLGVYLDCRANIAQVVTGARLLDAQFQATSGYIHQAL